MDKIDVINQAEKLQRKVNTYILSCIGGDGYPLTKADNNCEAFFKCSYMGMYVKVSNDQL